MEYLYSLIISVLIAIWWLLLFKKLKILDKPWTDLKNTRKPVPTLQWIFAYLSFWVIILVIFPDLISNEIFLWLSIWVLPILLVELVEELWYMKKIKFRIHPIFRLVVHILSSILAIWISGIGIGQELVLMWELYVIPQRIFMIFFAVWSIFCINAVNRVDWIYAQASWISAIGFLTIFLLLKFVVLEYYTEFNNLEVLQIVMSLSFVLFIISLVSTFIEYKPLWLLRDVWIMFFWFSLAYLSVVGWAKIWTLVVALSLVLFDAIRVWLYRIFIMKKNPIKWDYTHLHHRLIWLWRKRYEASAFMRVWSIVMMILILLQWTNRLNKIIIFSMMFIIFFWFNYYLFISKKLPCGLKEEK